MRIIKNERIIKRNGRIGQITSLVGLVVLAGGMIVSFRKPEWIGYAWLSLALGFILSQVGIYFGNRWGKRPRPDEFLDLALKGLDDRFTIYHYTSPVPHLLIGPAGLWLLMPYNQRGKITFTKGRWKQKGGGFMQAYLNLFAQEGLGRPDLEVAANTDSLKRFFLKNLPEAEDFPIQAAIVLTNEKAEIEAEDTPIPAVPLKKLKDLVRKTAKEKGLSPQKVEMIQGALEN